MKPLAEYIRRIGKARGFGIQSPWAFRFVTEVIGEKWPYYAYESIDRQYTARSERRYQKLMLRIRNYVYPSLLAERDIDSITADSLSNDITAAGKRGAIIIRGIYSNRAAKEKWNGIKNRPDIGITFDLYDFAICFLDTSIYKQHYILNF